MALDRCTNKLTYHKGNRCIVTWYILMNSAIRNPKVTSSPSTALSDIRFSDSMHMALTRIIPGTIFPVVSKQVSLEKKILFLDSRYMEQKSNRCPPPNFLSLPETTFFNSKKKQHSAYCHKNMLSYCNQNKS